MLREAIKRVGVHTLFVPDEQLDGAGAAIQPDPGIHDSSRLGAAPRDRGVDGEDLTADVSKQPDDVAERPANQHVRLPHPCVIDVGVLDRTAALEIDIDRSGSD